MFSIWCSSDPADCSRNAPKRTFIRASNSTYSAIDDPLGTGTFAYGINGSSQIVGFYSTGIVPLVGTAGILVGTNRIVQDVDLVTVRVNYRWGAPVVAKY